MIIYHITIIVKTIIIIIIITIIYTFSSNIHLYFSEVQISHPKLQCSFKKCCQKYDYLLSVTPPVALEADGLVLSTAVPIPSILSGETLKVGASSGPEVSEGKGSFWPHDGQNLKLGCSFVPHWGQKWKDILQIEQ